VCGRYTSTSTLEQLAEQYEVDEVRSEPLPARWNVAPTQQVYAVAVRRPREPGEPSRRQLGQFRWGLVPSWAKDPSVGNRQINARSEGLERKPAYRRALERRRCLIPADAFYEWQPQPGRKAKLPYVIRRVDGVPMAFAGLWEVWWDPAEKERGDPLRTCTIVTAAANELLTSIHDRMPVVLDRGDWGTWLDPDLGTADVQPLLRSAPDSWFEAYPVSSLVSNVANEGPELVKPLPPPPGDRSTA